MKIKQFFSYPDEVPLPPPGYEIDSVQCVTESTDYDENGRLSEAVYEYAHYPHSYKCEKASLEALAVPKNWDGDVLGTRTAIWDRVAGQWWWWDI